MDDKTDRKAHRGRKFRGKRLKTALPRPAAEPAPLPAKDGERVARAIARAGLCSRREAEAWIAAGRVAVNGATIASPAVNVGARDRVTVDGKPLPQRERTRLFLFHKPRGLVTTSVDTHGRPTIYGALPKDMPRLVSVGRLDLNTEGLLLLTNDGGLARALELPSTGWLRRYRVRAYGTIDQRRLDSLRKGIEVEGVRYGPIEAALDRVQGDNVWLTFAMREGKNREIRNVLGALGLKVNRLIRVSYGPFQLGEQPAGAVEEVRTRALRDQLGARIVALSGADFSGPIVERDSVERQATRLLRHPEVRPRASEARPGGASKGDGAGAAAQNRPGRPSFPPALAPRTAAGKQGAPKRAGAKAGEGRLRRPPQDDGERRGVRRTGRGAFRRGKRDR